MCLICTNFMEASYLLLSLNLFFFYFINIKYYTESTSSTVCDGGSQPAQILYYDSYKMKMNIFLIKKYIFIGHQRTPT